MSADLMTFLEQFVTDERLALFDRVLDMRTRHLTVVVEEVFQSHNANAVVRSCECFGIQDMHVIEGRNTFDLAKGVNMGAAKWVDIHHHDDTTACIRLLKDRGVRIVATTPAHRPDHRPRGRLHPGGRPLRHGAGRADGHSARPGR